MNNKNKMVKDPAIKTNYKESWLFFFQYYKKHKWWTISMILISFFISLSIISLPFLTMLLKEGSKEGSTNKNAFYVFATLILIISVIKIILSFFSNYVSGVFDLKMEISIRKDMMKRLHSLSMEQFDNSAIGVYFSRVLNDIKEVKLSASHLIQNFVTIFCLVIGGFSFIFYSSWIAGIITLSIYIITLLIYIFFRHKLVYHQQVNKSLNTFLTIGIGEHVQMITEIKSYNNSESTIKKFDILQNNYFKSTKSYIKKISWFKIIGIGSSIFISTSILLIGSFFLRIKNPWELAGLIMAANILIIPIEKTAVIVTDLITLNATIVRVKEFYSWKNEENNGTIKKLFQGEIEFNDVCFSYKVNNNVFQVFNHFNLKINRNKKTLLFGSFGTGKTTIFKLLMRYYEIDSGEILIDGINIKNYDLEFLRKNIAYQAYIPKLFSSSLDKEDLYPDKQRLNEIVKCLKLEDLIEKKSKIDMNINSQGLQVSDSEKQMLSILRSLYFNTNVVLLDFTEYCVNQEQILLVKKALNIFAKDKTIIFTSYKKLSFFEFDNYIELPKQCV